jgi:hypothetical protein
MVAALGLVVLQVVVIQDLDQQALQPDRQDLVQDQQDLLCHLPLSRKLAMGRKTGPRSWAGLWTK